MRACSSTLQHVRRVWDSCNIYNKADNCAPALGFTGPTLRVKPGEVSLAHLGVLFLDELPEFHGMAELLHQI